MAVKNEEEAYEKNIEMTKNLKDKHMERRYFLSLKSQKKPLLIFYKILSISYKNENAEDCEFERLLTNFQNLQQKNGTLLTVKQRVLACITILSNF